MKIAEGTSKNLLEEISPHSQIITRIIAFLQLGVTLLKTHRRTIVGDFLEISPLHIFAATKLSVGRSVFGSPKIFL